MGFSLKGYVIEKPRVGSANSTFTSTPDNLISDPGSYNAVFGTDESNPGRVEYLTLALVDGDLANAEFGWTKNEDGFARFDFDGAEARFVPLRGSVRAEVGTLGPDANTTRLKVQKPNFPLGVAPYRLAVGSSGSGTTFPIVTVVNDGAFAGPPVGSVELSLDTGNLNWNVSDLSTYDDQDVFFQRQAFFTPKESSGQLGIAGTDTILLTPIPGLGLGINYQKPNLRFGFGLYLTPIDVATEVAFSLNPIQGTFEWARDTGRVKFNATDLTNNNGEPVYYDGVLFERSKTLPRQTLGTVAAPSSIIGLPSDGADLVFRAVPTLLTGTGTFPSTTTMNDGGAAFLTNEVKAGDIVVLTGGLYAGSHRMITDVPSETQVTVAPPFPSVTGATYKIEKDIVQFPDFVRVAAFDTLGKSGQVQVDPSGAVQFSAPDVATYGTRAAEVIFGDLPIERGISLRFFRTPIDPAAQDPDAKDISAFFPTTGASWADPIVGMPFIFMPVNPIDDPAYPMTFDIEQGTGTFTGPLPRLDGPTPPSGFGYTLDFDKKQFNFAIRRNNLVIPIPVSTGAVPLTDPLVNAPNIILELDQGLGFVPLTLNLDALLEPLSGLVTFIQTDGALILEGTGAAIFTLTSVSQVGADFAGAGVLLGDLLFVLSGPSKGVYMVDTVGVSTFTFNPPAPSVDTGIAYEIRRGKEILADRFFQEALLVDPNTKVEKIRALGAITNSPRLNINPGLIGRSRFRLGLTFLSTPTVVTNDGSFTVPGFMVQGAVEVSQDTGNLNFSSIDVGPGGTIYGALKLIQGVEYRIEPRLGFIQTIERLLAMDELFLTYTSLQEDPPVTIIEERATFLVRKEVVSHPIPTSVMSFNPLGREIAINPSPAVFRGGRPQDETQISINPSSSTLTFLPDVLPTPGGDMAISDALPHGAIVQPSERVYIDYNVFNAIGGENTTTVLLPPINLLQVTITEGGSSFKAKGDQTSVFPADHLLRIVDEQAYMLAGSTYNAGTNETTVTILAPAVFRDGFSQPKLFVSSGPVRLTSLPFLPAYFVLEPDPFDTIPRGMNKFKLFGDKTGLYVAGVALYVTGGSPVINDFYLVTGSTFDVNLNRTEIVLTQSTARQYTVGTHTLSRSVRPVFESSTTTVKTSASPALLPPFTELKDAIRVFRQVEGAPGEILTTPTDFTIDDAGTLIFAESLLPSEEFSILYSKHEIINSGQLRASYTAAISPNATNGIENQRLSASFTTYSPDSFYFRVETLTNFRGELAQKYNDDSQSGPSGGPRLENAGTAKLFERGGESVYFPEGRLANEDLVARAVLKFYNDNINFIDDLLQNMDGRVVGDYDGRFKFDGTTGSIVSDFSLATNQIDDFFRISPFPIDFTPPLLPFKYLGTYLKAYEANAKSRFYPTARTSFSYTIAGSDTSAATGDQMLDLSAKKVTSTSPTAFRRVPRARVTAAASTGAATLQVDTTAAVETQPGPLRPAFVTGMKVVVRDPAGAYIVTEGSPATITVGGPTSLTLAPVLPGAVPLGSTVHLAGADTSYQKSYRIGFDVGLDADNGFLTYIKPYPPFDGSVPAVISELRVQNPASEELLQSIVTYNNSLVAPFKVPALQGQPFDDSGDQRLPLLNPNYTRETAPTTEPGAKPNLLSTELTYLGAGGSIATNTTPPFVGVGSLDGTATILTASFVAPLPQIGDLVRILDGLNGLTQFRRVSVATPTTVTVDVPFSITDSGFNFLITTATDLQTGTFSSIVGPIVTDLFANFAVNGVQAGHTVVLTQAVHPAKLERRQVASVDSATQLTLTAAFSDTTTPATYRVVNNLNTYSNLSGATGSLTSQIAILSSNPTSELNSIDNFFSAVFTDRLSPALASGNATAADTLVGIGVNFITSEVVAGDLVYIPPSQTNEGIYTVGEVVDSLTLKISDSPGFPSFPQALTFRIVQVFGVSAQALKELFAVRQEAQTYLQSILSWQTLLTTAVDVLVPPSTVDPSYFARGFLLTDLVSRETTVLTRGAYLDTTGIAAVEKLVSSGDRLYDKRMVWIDARINLEKGILVKQLRAVAERIKSQQKVLDQLIKLQAVE